MKQQNATGRLVAALRHAFAIPPEEKLSAEEQELLRRAAEGVVKRGLAAPAIFLLQTAKPLNYVGSQLLAFFQPILSAVFPREQCQRAVELLSRRQSIEALIQMIEEHEGRPAAAAPNEPTAGTHGAVDGTPPDRDGTQ